MGVACAAWLEQLAVVYANCGAFPKSILSAICFLCVLWPVVTSIDFEMKGLVKNHGQKFTRTSMNMAPALANTPASAS